MAIDFDALTVGPCMAAFATPVTYTPMAPVLDASGKPTFDAGGNQAFTVGKPYAAQGVFDAAYVEVMPGGAGPFPSTDGMEYGAPGGITEGRPVLGVQLSAMQTAPAQGDQVLINSTLYDVKEVQPDSHGWALLLLNLAP